MQSEIQKQQLTKQLPKASTAMQYTPTHQVPNQVGVQGVSTACAFGSERITSGASKRGPLMTCVCADGAWQDCAPNPTGVAPQRTAAPATVMTAAAMRHQYKAQDFMYDLMAATPDRGVAGEVRPLGMGQMPTLAGLGVSFTHFTVEPCGINAPHVHPRGTELLFVVKAEFLRTAFVEENGATVDGSAVVRNDIKTGQVVVFPQGLIHYQQNLGCTTAEYISALSSEDAGTVTLATRLFQLPEEGLAGTLGESDAGVMRLRDGLSALGENPLRGQEECLRRCALWQQPATAVAGKLAK